MHTLHIYSIDMIFKIFKIFAKNAKGFEALTLMFRTFGGNLRTIFELVLLYLTCDRFLPAVLIIFKQIDLSLYPCSPSSLARLKRPHISHAKPGKTAIPKILH